jgi:hypothetical protein
MGFNQIMQMANTSFMAAYDPAFLFQCGLNHG